MKLLTVVGARPQFVKAATVSRVLAEPAWRTRVSEILVHTGQHYDDAMSAAFFRELGIPEPRHNLRIGSGPHGAQTGQIMASLEVVLDQEAPDMVLVYGDTNSTLAAALVAAKKPVALAHVEAGLRSFRRGMPEEVNRVVTDRLSDLLFCPSEMAAGQLAKEGITRGVHVVGDVMFDGVLHERGRIDVDAELSTTGLQRGGYLLATVHRAENTDDPVRLAEIMDALGAVSRRLPVVLPLHPRTRSAMTRAGYALQEGIMVLEPQPYRRTLALLDGAALLATDSGGMQKEALYCGKPCITLRDETEWVETLESGWNRLAPPGNSDIEGAIRDVLAMGSPGQPPQVYGDGTSARKIVELLCR